MNKTQKKGKERTRGGAKRRGRGISRGRGRGDKGRSRGEVEIGKWYWYVFLLLLYFDTYFYSTILVTKSPLNSTKKYKSKNVIKEPNAIESDADDDKFDIDEEIDMNNEFSITLI